MGGAVGAVIDWEDRWVLMMLRQLCGLVMMLLVLGVVSTQMGLKGHEIGGSREEGHFLLSSGLVVVHDDQVMLAGLTRATINNDILMKCVWRWRG